DKAMQLAIQPYFAEDRGAITFHATVMIVQPHPCQPADREIEDAARDDLVPRIVAHALPAADHVEAVVHACEGARDFMPIALQVRIESQDNVAARGPKTRRQCRCFAEIATETDAAHLRMLAR